MGIRTAVHERLTSADDFRGRPSTALELLGSTRAEAVFSAKANCAPHVGGVKHEHIGEFIEHPFRQVPRTHTNGGSFWIERGRERSRESALPTFLSPHFPSSKVPLGVPPNTSILDLFRFRMEEGETPESLEASLGLKKEVGRSMTQRSSFLGRTRANPSTSSMLTQLNRWISGGRRRGTERDGEGPAGVVGGLNPRPGPRGRDRKGESFWYMK